MSYQQTLDAAKKLLDAGDVRGAFVLLAKAAQADREFCRSSEFMRFVIDDKGYHPIIAFNMEMHNTWSKAEREAFWQEIKQA